LGMLLSVVARNGARYEVLASDDSIQWTSVWTTPVATAGLLTFTDRRIPIPPGRTYQARLVGLFGPSTASLDVTSVPGKQGNKLRFQGSYGRLYVVQRQLDGAWVEVASTPPLEEMWAAWHTITEAADPYLDTLTTESLQEMMAPYSESVGNMLQRTTYHYWYHIGESQAIRQLLGHADLPQFVGDIRGGGPYRPEEHA